jgi:predicted DNA-binding ribbon-helix-helix protein
MSILRRKFYGEPVTRIIASVPVSTVNEIRAIIRRGHPARNNISEFVRLAIMEKLKREKRI